MKNRLNWTQHKYGDGWNSWCGRFRIVRCPDCYGEGYYHKLCWSGYFGQACQREYTKLGDAKRAAAMRARNIEVAA